jgi:DNA polymerase I-like protein with 3'-5' exonuclease and polymerase domains
MSLIISCILDKPRDTTKYNISGSDTFRLASRMLLQSKQKRDNTNFGGNRQNLEKSLRKVWLADEGYLLAQADQSGAEALIVAYLCKPAKYRTLFQVGIKPHTYIALKLFKEEWVKHFDPVNVVMACNMLITDLVKQSWWKELENIIKSSDNWSANKRYYHFAKKTVHAGSYGMHAPTFILQMLKESGGEIKLTLEQGKKFLQAFHNEFPEIQEWHNRIFNQVKTKHILRNLFGFPYNITYVVNDSDFKDLIAWIPQSTVACITRQAFCRLHEYIAENKLSWHILHDTHDSYLAEAPKPEINKLKSKMQEFMQIELISPFDNSKFRMKSEVQVGKNWSPYKESLNEDGLR